MDESYFRDRISGYFDRSLPPDEYQLVDDYLKDSPEGRALLEEIGRLDEFVRLHGDLQVDDGFFERQAQRIEARLGFESATPANIQPVPVRSWRTTTWKWIGVAASVATLAFIGYHQSDIFGPSDLTTESGPSKKVVAPAAGDTLSAQGVLPNQSTDDFDRAIGQSKETTAGESGRQKQSEAADEIVSRDLSTALEKPAAAEGSVAERPKPSPAQPAPEEPAGNMAESEPAPTSPGPSIKSEGIRKSAPAATRAQSAPIDDEDMVASPPIELTANEIATDTAALARYRTERSALMTELSKDSAAKTTLEREKVKPLSNSLDYSRRAAPATSALKADDRPERLLEACYQIARLTPDTTERTVMIEQIEAMATDSTSAVRDKARRYLDELTRK